MSPSRSAVNQSEDRLIRWVFLDRDGTLNVKAPDGEYVERPEDLKLLPGAAEAVGLLNRAGVWTALVTNQRGVALGRMDLAQLDAVHRRLSELLSSEGAFLDEIYVCPHESGECTCRKPQPGMLLQAQSEHPGLDFTHAAIVGDSLSDIQAGKSVGLRTVLIDPPAAAVKGSAVELADHTTPDLLSAVRLLLGAGRLRDLQASGD